jgi:hypothetical protein
MYEPHHHTQSNGIDDNELADETIPEDDISPTTNSRTIIHWKSDREGDMDIKQQINTDADYFDALFARSNASPPPSPHPRCYSSCSPSTTPFLIFTDTASQNYAKSQPHLTSSRSAKQQDDRRQSIISSTKSQQSNSALSPNSAQIKRKTFSLTHTTQAFLQSSNSQYEQSEPLARSCSYKRPQSIKKYRQQKKEKEKEQKEYSSTRKYSTQNNNILHTVASDSARKSISIATSRVSATDLMATDGLYDQWSSPKTQRSERVGKIKISDFFIFLLP